MDSTNNILPPGIWDYPAPEDFGKHDAFVRAWTLGEDELLEHWDANADKEPILASLAYSCFTKGSNTTDGRYNKYDITDSNDDATWQEHLTTLDFTRLDFGSTYIIASGEDVELPPSDDPLLKAQDMGYHYVSAFTRFQSIAIPKGAVINYARLKFTALVDSGSGSAVISGIDSDHSPSTSYEAQNWERSDYRVYYAAGAWTTGNVYYSPNIACVIQEIIDGPSWLSGDDILLFLDGYGSNYNRANDVYHDPGKSADLEIWWMMSYTDNMSGGVVGNSTAPVSLIYNQDMSGGLKANGQSDYGVWVEERTARHGEIWLDGSADVALSLYMRGGIYVNGSARQTFYQTPRVGGGLKVSGRAVWPSFPNGYTARHTIIVPAGAVSANLSSFLLGIVATVDGDMVSNNEYCITDTSSNTLPHDFRHRTGDTLVLYFRCNLLADSDNVFYLYYGSQYVGG